MLKAADAADVTDADVELLVQSDPIARQLFIELGVAEDGSGLHAKRGGAAAPSRATPSRFEQDLKMMQEQFDSRRAELADMVRQKKRSIIQMEAEKLQTAATVLRDQATELQKEVEKQTKEAKKFGNSTVDIEMMRADIKNLDFVLTGISTEREKLEGGDPLYPARYALAKGG